VSVTAASTLVTPPPPPPPPPPPRLPESHEAGERTRCAGLLLFLLVKTLKL